MEELKTGAKTEINLRNHFIRDAQVQVRLDKTLSFFVVESCPWRCEALSKALKINKSVTRINLEQNLIQDAGAQAMEPSQFFCDELVVLPPCHFDARLCLRC